MKEKILENLKKYKIIWISILITLLIEIFICNYGFFRTLIIGNRDLEVNYELNEKVITISDIDNRVTSINIEYSNQLTDKITYSLYYTIEESSDNIAINPKIILKEDKHYINFDTQVECQTIEIKCLTETDMQIKNIVLNHPNINIDIFRILFIFMAVVFAMQVVTGKAYKKEYDKNSKSQNGVFIINLATLCAFIILYALCQFAPESLLIKPEDRYLDDSIIGQTEALVNGQIALLEEPSEELKNMENPYDHIKRDNEGVPYLYDVAYYNGQYYNYFGIAPILTSILPFRLITGMYTHTYIFNMIYILIAVFALYFLYKKLVNKYIEKISLCNFYLGFYAILFGSNLFTLLRGAKYDIVVSSGIAFILISLNLALSIYSNSKFKILKLILLGITTGLIVLSKPNLIVYYIIIAFCLLMSMKELSIKEKIKDAIFICIPLGILAIFQMILNYIRFDNILEFGATYQLTGLNMNVTMIMTFGKIYAGIVEYLFRTITINPLVFPFVFVNTNTALTAINEICYENKLIGLISIPIMWGLLLKGNVVKKADNKELKFFIRIALITVILAIIITTCFGGICEVYSIDFKLMLAIVSVLILLKWLENNSEKEDINRVFLILCVATIVIMVPLGLTTELGFFSNFASDTSVWFKNIFEFWA